MARIVISTIGSKGDLFPYLAVAKELQLRNHQVIVATSPAYEKIVVDMSLGFASIRPDIKYDDPELARISMDLIKGTEYVVKDILMHNLKDTYYDLLKACENADMLVSHTLCFAGSLVAEKLQIPWVSIVLSPNNFWSSHDPSVLPNAPFFIYGNIFGPRFNRNITSIARYATRNWVKEFHELKEDLGLERKGNPLFEGMHSPSTVLALFSSLFAKRQPDWPAQTIVSGFARLDEKPVPEKAQKLDQFMRDHPNPIVFTLGTAAVLCADSFYQYCYEAIKQTNESAILLTGPIKENAPALDNDRILCLDYLPYSQMFPKAKLVVHHGGIGTTAQTLYSGVPSIVVPHSHDQPDNARRLGKLGVAISCNRHKATAKAIKKLINSMVSNPDYKQNAVALSNKISHENGAIAAADVIEIKIEEFQCI